MIEQFTSYSTKLERLSNDELHRSAEKLVLGENTTLAKLIAHLAEMSSRKTALKLGYKSLYEYCITGLNLSEGAVPTRIHVANVSRRFPQLLVALAESRISLTVAALLAPHLTKDNVDKVISDCAGMKRKETEEYMVAFRPKPVFEPSIRKRPAPPVQVESPSPFPPSSSTPSAASVEAPKSSPPILQPAQPEVFNFRFSANRDFKDKLDRLAEVVGVENAQKNMAALLEKALDIALEKKDPKKKLERRRKRERASATTAPSRSNEIAREDEPAESRYIAAEVLERVHERGGYQCTYRAPDGRRCTARAGLHIDHSEPFGIFHSNEELILRLLCASHNGLEAERVYGPAFIQRKIDERGKARQARRS
ncbi:MAG: hypothetical protein E2P02_06380 [Acidobacteria bacterium]|nr:MAG: hypothetical protein E2P02_06380 [Acidobacteriota bacterium]